MRKFIIILLFALSSCQSQQDRLYAKLSKDDYKIKEYKGHYKLSEKDTKNKAKDHERKAEIGVASWYGKKHLLKKSFHGKKTANGDRFNTDALTGAHRTLPIPSVVKVTNLHNNKSLLIMINDRGPYHKERLIDVSAKVASILDFKIKGTAKVQVEYMQQETKALLDKLALKPIHGKKPVGKIKEPKCTINCFMQLLNIEKGYLDHVK